ncbi:MAG TPA: LytTR family DNA-binding domain-containing protein [Chitinophagaceae bacterium]|nr:LytTR family DNA-binding domain-containing protein [Chitinophagaceae bacterium]
MKTIIIEDEKPAAEKLQKALLKCAPSVQVLAILGSVRTATEWLQQNPMPGCIFMDIDLTDGLSFRIFEQVAVDCPVIFTTAYDEYWQEAFEHNSIDYLLKPIRQDKLEAALKKYEKLKQHFAANYRQLANWQQQGNADRKKRFLVKRGTDYISIKTEEIAYFYAAQKLVCLVDSKSQKFILDQSLADLEKQVDPSQFYRVNRKYLVNLNAIRRIRSYPKSKLQLEIQPAPPEDIIISQENAAAFKAWMEQ